MRSIFYGVYDLLVPKLLLLPYKPQTFGLYGENLKTRFVALPLRPHSSLISSEIIVLVAKI